MTRRTKKPPAAREPAGHGRELATRVSLALLGACSLSLALYLLAHSTAARQIVAWMAGR